MKKDKKFLIYALIVGLFVLTIAVIRSCLAGITYDEAYTYLNYVKDNPIMVFKALFTRDMILANNHLLNSFGISLVQFIFRIRYSDFLIRLPNLISYAVYLFFAYKLAQKYQHKYLVFTSLACCYGLNEFISLARGYGIACSIVIIGLYYLKVWLDDTSKYKYLNLAYLFLMVSCYANTTCLLVFASVIVFSQLYILINKKIKENFFYIKKNIIILIPIILGTLLIIYFHFKVSSDGLPLYGGNTGFLTDVLASYTFLYGINFYNNIIVIVGILLLMIIVIKYRKKLIKLNVAYVAIIYFILLAIMTLSFKQLWLTRRLLIPSIPLVMITVFEIIDNVKIKNKFVNVIVVSIPIVLFSININLYTVRTWEDNQLVKENAYKAYQEKNNELVKPYLKNPAIKYYQEKILEEYDYNILEGVN